MTALESLVDAAKTLDAPLACLQKSGRVLNRCGEELRHAIRAYANEPGLVSVEDVNHAAIAVLGAGREHAEALTRCAEVFNRAGAALAAEMRTRRG
jgi:hypothetical protein